MRRTSLLARLLVVTVLVAVASVVGTAFLTSTTAFRFDQEEFGHNQEADAYIADALTGYAATHTTWSEVGPLIEKLSSETGRRIAIQGSLGTVLSDTKPGVELPANSTAEITPLAVGYDARGEVSSDIDSRAVGPYRLTAADSAALQAEAERVVACINQTGFATFSVLPSGRPVLKSDRSETVCGEQQLAQPVASERTALDALVLLVNACLAARNAPPLDSIATDFSPITSDDSAATGRAALQCLHTGRAQQLQPWVAPTVVATMTDAVGDQRGILDLTPGSVGRITLVSVIVLSLVLAVTMAIGIPIRRRLRSLTQAAAQVANGEVGVQVPVRGTDELAQLSVAFNEMSHQRALSEQLRVQLNSDVAHELRTPLTNLLGWLEAAEDGVATYNAALNSTLLGETRQLIGIVADLQTLTVADAGGLHLRDDELDLAALLAAVVDSHSHRAAREQVALTLRCTPQLQLRGDGGRIRQVVDNLVTNALDHTPAGGGVTVTADEVGGTVRVRIADTGEGIAAADLPSVFERFWRADKSRSRVSGGTGLGLSIVRKLVEAHGGQVSVSSVVGEGTVFTVTVGSGRGRTRDPSSSRTTPKIVLGAKAAGEPRTYR